jgi:hypothetical protein
MKVILALSVPDEGYSREALYALNSVSTFLLLHFTKKELSQLHS